MGRWRYEDGIPYSIVKTESTRLGSYELFNGLYSSGGCHDPSIYILEGRIDRLLFGDDLVPDSSVNLIFSMLGGDDRCGRTQGMRPGTDRRS